MQKETREKEVELFVETENMRAELRIPKVDITLRKTVKQRTTLRNVPKIQKESIKRCQISLKKSE